MKFRNCSPKSLRDRSLLTIEEAISLNDLFQVLANDTRLRIIHTLARNTELCVGDIAHQLDMKPQAISNQLQRLTDQKIVSTRRDGNKIYYRAIDPCIPRLLELGLCLLEEPRPEAMGAG